MHPSVAQIDKPMAAASPLIKFAIRVWDDIDEHTYTGIYKSSCDATTDAQERFPTAQRITVRRVKHDQG